MEAADKVVQAEILPFIRVYRSGRIERLFSAKQVPPSVDPCTGATSMDIIINPSTGLSARIYLPLSAIISSPLGRKKLPIIVYYHGGGFCSLSTTSLPYNTYLNSLVFAAEVVAVSVDYRLAPEHPLPAAYDDSWEALLWVAEQTVWPLAEFGDRSRIFLVGDSAGANIVHNMGMRLGERGMQLEGLAMVHPFFWGKKRMKDEGETKNGKKVFSAESFDTLWPFVCPASPDLDDPRLNPMAEGAEISLAELGSRRILVSLVEKDILRGWGMAYFEKLKEDGWGSRAELFETKGKGHVFHVFQRPEEKAAELMERLACFFNYERKETGRFPMPVEEAFLLSNL